MVLPLPPVLSHQQLRPDEIEITTQRGSGAGGQHKNKTDSEVRARHIQTGITVVIDGRDQSKNKAEAIKILTARVNERNNQRKQEEYSGLRTFNTGRGDKIRTYNFNDSRVVNHQTGKKTKNIKQVLKGHLDLIK